MDRLSDSLYCYTITQYIVLLPQYSIIVMLCLYIAVSIFSKTVESLTQTCSVCQSACYSSECVVIVIVYDELERRVSVMVKSVVMVTGGDSQSTVVMVMVMV